VRYDPFDWLAKKGFLVKHTQLGGKKLRDHKVPIAAVLGSYPNIYHFHQGQWPSFIGPGGLSARIPG
jgi:hypothetical protein